MLNLTTLQGLFYYINNFKDGALKFDMLQGLKVELLKTKYRNKNNLYVIYEDNDKISIISHDIYTNKFNDLINNFNQCVYINNSGIHLKHGGHVETFRILNYNDTLNILFKDLEQKETAYHNKINIDIILSKITNNINKWYTLEDAQTVYNEYLKNNIKLIPRFSKCKKYVYFDKYNMISNRKINNINFNNDIYNINCYPCVMLIDNDGKPSFILNDIISNDKNYIQNKFNDFKLKCIKDGKRWNLDNSKLSYVIL